MNSRTSGIIAAVSAFTLWGLLTIYWKALEHFNAFELVSQRIVWSSIVLAIVITATRSWRALTSLSAADKRRVALAGLLITINWTSYVYAVVHDRVVETALGYFMSPIALVAIGVIVLGEKLRRAQIAAIALAIAAVVVISVSYGRFPVFAFLIMASWSAYALLKRRVPLSPTQSLAGETMAMVIPAIVVAGVMWGHHDSIPHSADGWHLVLVALTGIVTVIPLTLFAVAAKHVPFTLLGPLQYIVPSINFLLGVLVYHEKLAGAQFAGFMLVWVGLVIFTIDNVRSARQRAAAEPASAPTADRLIDTPVFGEPTPAPATAQP